MEKLKQVDPKHHELLRERVYEKFTDEKGFYFCANSGYKSTSKFNFHIDHIKPMHNGGLTILENLQLLTRKENTKKGVK